MRRDRLMGLALILTVLDHGIVRIGAKACRADDRQQLHNPKHDAAAMKAMFKAAAFTSVVRLNDWGLAHGGIEL